MKRLGAGMVLCAMLAVPWVWAQTPGGTWRTPGEFKTPTGKWQTPGPIQIPRGLQAIKSQKKPCVTRLTVGADALFEFDKSTLSPQAEETLKALGPVILKQGKHPAVVEGHTDSIGSAAYNQTLSEARARTVQAWLVKHHYLPTNTPIVGYGKNRPIAPNVTPDGKDDPAGRQKNRRVEVVIDTCK